MVQSSLESNSREVHIIVGRSSIIIGTTSKGEKAGSEPKGVFRSVLNCFSIGSGVLAASRFQQDRPAWNFSDSNSTRNEKGLLGVLDFTYTAHVSDGARHVFCVRVPTKPGTGAPISLVNTETYQYNPSAYPKAKSPVTRIRLDRTHSGLGPGLRATGIFAHGCAMFQMSKITFLNALAKSAFIVIIL